MMEFEYNYLDDLIYENFMPSQPPVPTTQSSFVSYTKPSFWFAPSENRSLVKRPNVHKRMLDILRKIPKNKGNNITNDEGRELEKDRSYRNMISERLRREKQRNIYDALHTLFPPGTKRDKITILQMAALNLRELKNLKDDLHKRNHGLENSIVSRETGTFWLRRPFPPSGIDSMIGVLTTMKDMGLKARSIQSQFSSTEFFTVLEIERKIEAAMLENAVERALEEVERKSVYDVTQW